MMDAPASPLILTKLRVPTPRLRMVLRARLIERLNLEMGTGLTLVCAPAGYGKSTLLAAWSQSLIQRGIAVAWYALDASDDDPIPFGAYLVTSLSQSLGPTAELAYLTQLVRSSPETDLQKMLPVLINAITVSDRDCVLILDDYHLIGTPAIHSALAFLLEHLPENLHVVIGSRADPPLPLARLRARGQLLELRAADLRFAGNETALFLNEVMRLDLAPQLIGALEDRTEGWVAGLQLAALSLAGRADQAGFIAAFAGSHRYLVEYLLEEVVSRQSEEVQAFLQFTSILDRLCGPLCDAMLKAESEPTPFILHPSSFILDQLERTNLFVIPLDDEGGWYRYHHLFRDFLRNQLDKSQPERVAALHRSASEWLAAHGFWREAVQHAFQTGEWTYAATVVEQHSFTMIMHSEISTIYEWCSAFPEEVMRQRPMLCILQGLALAYRFRRQNHARVEARLKQADQQIAAVEDNEAARGIIEMAAVVRTFLAMAPDPRAGPQTQRDLARVMLDYYPESHPGQFSGLLLTGYADLAVHDAQAAARSFETARQIALQAHLFFGVVESTFHLARLTHSQGQLRRAAEICRQGQADIASLLTHPERELPALGCLDIALGCVLLEQDQLIEAEEHLLRGLELIGWGMNPYYVFTACTALFQLRMIQGRSTEATEYLTRLEETWPDIAFCTRALRIMLALRTTPDDPAMLTEARTWCQDFSSSLSDDVSPPGLGPLGAAEAYYLTRLAWVRAQIAIDSASATRSYLERQIELAEAHGLLHRVIELSLLDAQALRAEGNSDRAWAVLDRALSAAQPAGYVRIFDQGIALTRLLVEATQRGGMREKSRAYLERILAAIGTLTSLEPEREGESGAIYSNQTSDLEFGERLSEREIEVLRLMARGASNQEIAEQLVIAVGTVKSHINHILGKLEARNRTEAVARARGLGLLEI